MNLQELKNLGVRELRISGGQAVAVNPYPFNHDHDIYPSREFSDLQIIIDDLPPLPCHESVKEGTYPIERFSEQWQWLNVVQTNEWENITPSDMDAIIAHNLIDGSKEFRQILVLSEPVAESKFPKYLDWKTLPTKEEAEAGNLKRRAIQAENKRANEVAEKPEGESVWDIAREEFKKVPDDGLFPNHTDQDVWTKGFIDGFEYAFSRVAEALKTKK